MIFSLRCISSIDPECKSLLLGKHEGKGYGGAVWLVNWHRSLVSGDFVVFLLTGRWGIHAVDFERGDATPFVDVPSGSYLNQ